MRLALVLFIVLGDVAVVAAQPSETLQGLLRPGSRAAAGMGGNPFLSALDDQSGWWKDVRPPGRGWVRAEASSGVPFAKSATRNQGRLSASELSFKFGHESRFRGRRFITQVRVVNPYWDRSWQGPSGGITTSGSATRLDVGIRLVDLLPNTTLQAVVPTWQSNGVREQGLHVGLRYEWSSIVQVQGSWGRNQLPELLHFDVQQEPLDVSMNLETDTRRIDARVHLPVRFSVEGSIGQTYIGERQAINTEPVYHMTPSGQVDAHDIAVAWGNAGGVRALWRYSGRDLGSFGNIAWGGQQFGKLNYARADLLSRLLAVQLPVRRSSRLLLEYEDVETDAQARGEFETWPFTSTVVDLLGHRRIGKGWMQVDWRRWHAGLDTALGSRCRWKFGLSWYDVRSDAVLDSWRPAFLVFGRADERRDRLAVESVQLAAIALGSRIRVAGMELAFGLEQFVPLQTTKRAVDGESSSGDPATVGGPLQGSSRPSWPSGTILEFSLTQTF